jgi:ribulose-bisphosphate carboxylase large chain
MMAFYSGYVDPTYRPNPTDLLCLFTLRPAAGVSVEEAAGAVAGESSVGTWTDVSTGSPRIKAMGARVFSINGHRIQVAYPQELFEQGNMAQIFSSVAGNIFGMKVVDSLRLEDIKWPAKFVKGFPGPKFGIKGIRKMLRVPKRPLCGTIIKPKLGLREKEHARVAYEAWRGGLDIVKDDENLTSQPFNNFDKRVRETLKLRDKAEKETGERKIYMPNVSAEYNEMLRRAKFVKRCGGEYIMVDILTVGWSALQALRNENLGLVMHAHRAMHAALTRNKEHGISMFVLADAAKLCGVDQLHIGTAVGKMEGPKEEVVLLSKRVKPVFPVCSGGLHPGHVPELMKMLGNDIIIQAGGGIHGHPDGTAAGAAAMRQAIDAVMGGVPLGEYAKSHKELRLAVEKWGTG